MLITALLVGSTAYAQSTHDLDLQSTPTVFTLEQQAAIGWIVAQNTSPALAQAIVLNTWRYAEAAHLDPHHILAMIRVESHFNPHAHSSEGAKGLMQVIPRWHRVALAKRSPYDPAVSIEVGTSIYSACLTKTSGNVHASLACYSGGARHYHRLVNEHKRALMHYIVAQLFAPPSPVVVALQ